MGQRTSLAAGVLTFLFALSAAVPPRAAATADNSTFSLSGGGESGFPIAATAAIPAITAISAGREHTCALFSDGTARCWGRNDSGQLGDGTTTNRLAPVLVPGMTSATAISAGASHTCALLADHTVRCWGHNFSGQLGDGTTTDRPSPVAVSGINTATAIASGTQHSCALLADHTVRCWGANWSGQLGDDTTTDHLTPVPPAGITTATALAAGELHTCVRLADGSVRCWGGNLDGQLGDGTTTDRLGPVVVSGIGTATAVSAGAAHTCAILAGGAVRCWGSNERGELGDGTTTRRFTPVAVAGITTATAIDVFVHSCAILAGGAVRCWGWNGSGELGDGTTTQRLTPVVVSGISTATAMDAGYWHTCAVLEDGSARCWGSNDYGQLGNGASDFDAHPNPVAVAWPTPFTDIAGSPFKPDIEWVYTAGITSGCTATAYCPEGYVTREQMASFLARALKLTGTAPDAFTDDEASPHEPNINLVAKAGIATGCAATKYCPAALVSREQMASFLARALKLAGTAPDAFTDDEQSIHEPNINLVAKAGVATGCGNGKYCPTANVTRGQMAAFLHRAFGP